MRTVYHRGHGRRPTAPGGAQARGPDPAPARDTQPTIARIERGQVEASLERVLELVRAAGFDLEVRVVPLDEDALALAEQNLARSPDERLDSLLPPLGAHRPEGGGGCGRATGRVC